MRRRIDLEIVIAVATTISIFTVFRLSFFGLGELLFIAIIVRGFTKRTTKVIRKQFVLSRFWIVFLIASSFGMFFEWIILSGANSSLRQVIYDFAAYIFVFFVCITLEKIHFLGEISAKRTLVKTFWVSSLTMVFLFVLSWSREELFGYSLHYYHFFAPFVDNTHQSSSYLVALPFVGLFLFKEQGKNVQRLALLAIFPLLILMPLNAGSAKAIMGIIAGFCVLGALFLGQMFGRRYLVLMLVVYLAIGIVARERIDYFWYATDFFDEEDNRGTRSYLYRTGFSLVWDSPLVGYGPGTHIRSPFDRNAFMEAHQTPLTALLQGGVVGLAAWLVLVYRGVRVTVFFPALAAALAALMVYALGGDILRRLPLWVLMFLIVYSGHVSGKAIPARRKVRLRWRSGRF